MNDDDLIRLFVELTGSCEEQVRSVLIHLDLFIGIIGPVIILQRQQERV